MTQRIYNKINELLQTGEKKFAIYPCGKRGKELQDFLFEQFGIEHIVFIDNKLCGKDGIISCSEVPTKLGDDYIILLVSDHQGIFYQLRKELLKYASLDRIIDVLSEESSHLNLIHDIQEGKKTKIIFNPIYKLTAINDPLIQVGYNTGNLVFSEEIKNNTEYDYETFMSSEWKIDGLGKENVRAIMPAANFLSKNTTWIENLIPILESTDMKFTLAGLGAQAKLNETPKDVVSELSKGQRRFFELVSERARTIGVRGEFTAECMEYMGIKNVDIIGCPSFYKYKGCYKKLKTASMDRVMCTLGKNDKKIYNFADYSNAKIVSQTYEDVDDSTKNIFFNYDDWSEFMLQNNFTFAFGTRFHGNMMALNHGVPTLWIVHDWRTLELVEYLKLPHIKLYDEFQHIKNPDELIEYCDYTNVYENYSALEKKYSEFIDKNLN